MIPDPPSSSKDAFLLGEIKATVVATAEDVRAVRLDIGSIATRLSAAEKAIGEIKAERAATLPDSQAFRTRVESIVAMNTKRLDNAEGGAKGIQRVMYGLYLLTGIAVAVSGVLVSIVMR